MGLLLMIVASYVLGSIPTSLIAGKLLKKIDIREHGSGNAGATNTFRVLGWKAGLTVLLFDIGKGLFPTVSLAYLGAETGLLGSEPMVYQIVAGMSAVFGHIWTIFAGFKGGKGVGTAAGMVIGLAPLPVLICIAVFVITVAFTRYVSLGSILSALTLPVVVLLQKYQFDVAVPDVLTGLSIFVPVLIIVTHRANIKRLLNGTENKFNFKKT